MNECLTLVDGRPDVPEEAVWMQQTVVQTPSCIEATRCVAARIFVLFAGIVA